MRGILRKRILHSTRRLLTWWMRWRRWGLADAGPAAGFGPAALGRSVQDDTIKPVLKAPLV